MEYTDESIRVQCQEAVDRLIEQWGLDLDAPEREHWIERTTYYVQRHTAYLDKRGRRTPQDLPLKIAENYFRDGKVVETLAGPLTTEYDALWAKWIQRVQRWTIRAGFRQVRPGPHGPQEELSFSGGDLDLDCMVATKRALPSFNFASRFTTWLYSIFLHQASNWRDRGRSREPPPGKSPSLDEPLRGQQDGGLTRGHLIPADTPSPEEESRHQLLLQAVERAVHELVEAGGTWPAAVYAWREHAKGVPQVEIARQLGRSAPTISRYVRAVREALRRSPEVERYL